MNDDKDKVPPEEERTVFVPSGGGEPPAEKPITPIRLGSSCHSAARLLTIRIARCVSAKAWPSIV